MNYVGQPAAIQVGASLRTSQRVYTASGTWTKPFGLKQIVVTVVGAGGAGGISAPTAPGQGSAGGGAGAGGYAQKLILASALAASEVVTVGQPVVGSTGGTSSFGAHCSATGGSPGASGTASGGSQTDGNPAGGGDGVGGDINIRGGDGDYGWAFAGAGYSHGGHGGNSVLGMGGCGGKTLSVIQLGNPGRSYGGGAGGTAAGPSNGSGGSASGGAGIVIVEEFYADNVSVSGSLADMVLLAEKVANNTSDSIIFTNLTGFAAYRFVFDSLLPSTDNISLVARLSTDNGSSYDATNNYQYAGSGYTSAAAPSVYSSGLADMFLFAQNIRNTAGYGVSGEIVANSMQGGGGRRATLTSALSYWNNAGHITQLNGAAQHLNPATINAIRFFASAGNWASGRVLCYGMRGAT